MEQSKKSKKNYNLLNGQIDSFSKHVFSKRANTFFDLPIHKIEVTRERKKFDIDKFLLTVSELYGNIYEYDISSIVKWDSNMSVHCYNCKSNFIVTPINHQYNNLGCSNCFGGKPQNSKGEKKITSILNDKQIKYYRQYTFNDCGDLNKLRFDFYIPTEKLLIEFDGKQHFQPIDFFGGMIAFNTQKRRDQIKNEYAKRNDIRLIRISYLEFNNIENILNKVI